MAQFHRAITIGPSAGVPTCHLSVIYLSTDDSSMSLWCICVCVFACSGENAHCCTFPPMLPPPPSSTSSSGISSFYLICR